LGGADWSDAGLAGWLTGRLAYSYRSAQVHAGLDDRLMPRSAMPGWLTDADRDGGMPRLMADGGWFPLLRLITNDCQHWQGMLLSRLNPAYATDGLSDDAGCWMPADPSLCYA
jgi:hypothetical protein